MEFSAKKLGLFSIFVKISFRINNCRFYFDGVFSMIKSSFNGLVYELFKSLEGCQFLLSGLDAYMVVV